MMQKILWLVVIVLVILGVYALMNKQQAEAPTTETSSTEYTIAAGDQKPGAEVLVATAVLAKPAYLLIHRATNSAPGEVIGETSLLPAGVAQNVAITLRESVQAGEQLFIMAHNDDNGNGMLDYIKDEKMDVPTVDAQSQVVMTLVNVK